MNEADLRVEASKALAECDPVQKMKRVQSLNLNGSVDASLTLEPSMGRPLKPVLVSPGKVPTRGLSSPEGKAMLLHALAHIEFNAINLALDIAVRFDSLPLAFYTDWLKVAQEEAYHHALLCDRLKAYGVSYGDFPAHDGLWQMAQRTADSLFARLALVPRLLEARGLDVSPAIRTKLANAGDSESAAVLDVILRDEIGHVAIGNRWFGVLCEQRGLDPVDAFAECLVKYSAPEPRSPFNFPARERAGFSPAELQWLLHLEQSQSGSVKT
ncbi:ferritin-like domain-containing protein [Limnobacter litoralis]|uniref:Ferritin-like domain-containing protein n=1 Tax=Limnobacter litoralis TaxID=481366 RepID=A0ABQ5YXT8_9BURK|nr:ferritin-like domain-containing protein [Limnobacter litoralis]GLR27718.1 hypothetical protein GCM10007875_28100 [Limnobacter litoralis]